MCGVQRDESHGQELLFRTVYQDAHHLELSMRHRTHTDVVSWQLDRSQRDPAMLRFDHRKSPTHGAKASRT
jgi:hypothetical protein